MENQAAWRPKTMPDRGFWTVRPHGNKSIEAGVERADDRGAASSWEGAFHGQFNPDLRPDYRDLRIRRRTAGCRSYANHPALRTLFAGKSADLDAAVHADGTAVAKIRRTGFS